jgi:glutamine amidotransferase
MLEVAIIDYGVGNLLSLKCALQKVGFDSKIASSPSQMKNIDAIVLPGVGNFSAASTKLESFREEITESIKKGLPLFGICLGMQLFFPESEEGEGRGLTLFQGKNARLPSSVKVPHMGWNTLEIVTKNEIFEGLDDNCYVYFVHSLYPVPADKNIICAQTSYGVTFTSVIAKQNVYGTQFHPEKSGAVGLRILGNFFRIVKR